ncbi:MAG: ABC transporter substrate-binding protein [Betaproteobacteria bacterium]
MTSLIARSAVIAAGLAVLLLPAGCKVANQPYPDDEIAGNVFYTSFQERPKYLDPASSYNVNETPWTYAVYEPLLGYHYLKRPYTLEGRAAVDVPTPLYLDKEDKPLPNDAPADQIKTSVYTFRIKPGTRYQPHPALAKDAGGKFLYHDLKPEQLKGRYSILDFPLDQAAVSTREATADDFVYEIKRLASPYLPTPVPLYNLLNQYIVGLKDLGDRLKAEHKAALQTKSARDQYLPWRDLREVPCEGVRAVDAQTLEIRVIGKYPQFRFWLAMTMFVPIPWEADRFYAQRGMAGNTLTLNAWPIGTGPFMLSEQDANRYVLLRNPNYREELYPAEGMPGDREHGWLDDAGKRMPFLDKAVFYLEKEREPEESKFMQGYYDNPDVSRLDIGFPLLKEQMDKTGRWQAIRDHGINMVTSLEPNNWYIGFNMLDPVVGAGDTPAQQEKNRKLRQALSIATDWEEYAAVFFDNYGPSQAAMGPIPPGLFGYVPGEEGINPVTHVWQDGRAVRRTIAEARKLLAEAGYPDGRDARSGKPLVIFYDSNGVGPAYQARLDWQAKQWAKIGVQTEVRANDYNRFQDRIRKGNAQTYFWGWFADYPDAENYLFLLTSSQGKVKFDGENASNYANPEFDKLYERMKSLADGPERKQLMDQMVQTVQQDAPWSFGIFPGSTGVYQRWLHNAKPSGVINDRIRYLRVDGALRAQKIAEWNQPRVWPLGVGALVFALLLWPARRLYLRRENANARASRVAIATGEAE